MEPTQLGPIEINILCSGAPATTPLGFIKLMQHKPPMRVGFVNLLGVSLCVPRFIPLNPSE
jgi:hypothetical protein